MPRAHPLSVVWNVLVLSVVDGKYYQFYVKLKLKDPVLLVSHHGSSHLIG